MEIILKTNNEHNGMYLLGKDCFLISIVKGGGNSGSPAINSMGKCAGVLVNIPSDAFDRAN
jgi:hypothetical protein